MLRHIHNEIKKQGLGDYFLNLDKKFYFHFLINYAKHLLWNVLRVPILCI